MVMDLKMPTNSPPSTNDSTAVKAFTFIIEHLDPELGPWSALEYRTIATECRESGNQFILSSVSLDLRNEGEDGGLRDVLTQSGRVEGSGVEELFPPSRLNRLGEGRGEDREGVVLVRKPRVCLLDPQAERELDPRDGEEFEGFLFGGILGKISH